MRFADRRHAGELLAKAVVRRGPVDPVVYGLPRGGVPVAFEVAIALECPLEVLGVAKVGLPSQPELALGAVAEDGTSVRNDDLLRQVGLTTWAFDELASLAQKKLASNWRGDREFLSPAGKTAVVVDDGVATGATARAGVEVARELGAEHVWLAVPVAPSQFETEADVFVTVHQPRRFIAVGHWYDDFRQTTDDEVATLLQRLR